MKSLAGTLAAQFGAKPFLWNGQPTAYLATARGRIWSCRAANFMKPWAMKGGYLGVALRVDGRTVKAHVAHLVAAAFHGQRPPGHDVCHNDGNRQNNEPTNLRYATRAQNLADRDRHGTAQIGDRNPAAKLSNAQANDIRRRRASGELLRVLAAEFGVRESAISRIANGHRRAAC